MDVAITAVIGASGENCNIGLFMLTKRIIRMEYGTKWRDLSLVAFMKGQNHRLAIPSLFIIM